MNAKAQAKGKVSAADDEGAELLDTDKVRSLRESLGMSQEQAASKAGLTGRQQWYRMEAGIGGLTLRTLAKVAKALGVKPKDLLK